MEMRFIKKKPTHTRLIIHSMVLLLDESQLAYTLQFTIPFK